MKNINGRLLQKNSISLSQTNKLTRVIELLLLSGLGILAVVLHARLKLGLGIPGHHGFIFMSLIMAGRLNSRLTFASSVSTLASALFLYLPVLGFKDPFMPVIYLAIGVTVDLFHHLLPQKKQWIIVALTAGLAYMMIPLLRLIIMHYTGFPYLSFRQGIMLPFITHFAFGALGGIGVLSIKKVLPKRK